MCSTSRCVCGRDLRWESAGGLAWSHLLWKRACLALGLAFRIRSLSLLSRSHPSLASQYSSDNRCSSLTPILNAHAAQCLLLITIYVALLTCWILAFKVVSSGVQQIFIILLVCTPPAKWKGDVRLAWRIFVLVIVDCNYPTAVLATPILRAWINVNFSCRPSETNPMTSLFTARSYPFSPQTMFAFIFKKVLLAFTNPFPLRIAMLMSGKGRCIWV